LSSHSLSWRPPDATAKRFVILRHAEKTGLPADRHLSPAGHDRALALCTLPEYLGAIHAIIAAQSVPKSVRPKETVEPLAAKLGLPIITSWNTHDLGDLASALKHDVSLAGKQILICWRHDALQALAHALGARDAPSWPNTLYDRIWLATCSADGVELLALRQIFADGSIRLVRED
jgi:hypothetical protein